MDSSSGVSSGSGDGIREENPQEMDIKKRKRMISNRESARRSRLRKQNHANSLMTQAAQLRIDKSQILAGFHMTTQLNLRVEAENAVLRAQAAELSHRLHALNEIASSLSHVVGGSLLAEEPTRFMNYLYLDQSQPMFFCG